MHCVTMAGEALNASKTCPQQKKGFKKVKPSKQQHSQKVKEALRLMCDQCGYRTRISGNLRVHKRRHTGEKPFQCSVCYASFAARYQLTTHIELHMDATQRRSRHLCIECNLGFLSARALYHHKPLHAAEKKYKCVMCNKSFAQAAGYAQHKRWHRLRNERATAISKMKTADATEI